MKFIVFSLSFLICSTFAALTFPPDFLFGSATAAYQIEGAWNISRGPSVWDDFCRIPGKVANGDNGDVADDHYHRYVEDVALLKQLGFKNYRFSISWSRLFPTGVAPANADGFQFYSNLIDELKRNDIEPFVTLFHWDTPSALPGAWLNNSIVDAFAAYANATFAAFGDRVNNWITFNEPLTVCFNGYGVGVHAPGRCSDRTVCTEGNSSTEPYIVAHNMLLSHSAAVQLFRTYHKTATNKIGITLNCDWAEPYSNLTADYDASVRRLEFQLAWFADPVFKGDYPQSMKDLVGERLPVFTDEQKQQINGSWDYFGLNHYTSAYSQDYPSAPTDQGWDTDQQVNVSQSRNGVLIGAPADSPWLIVVPYGINKLLQWVSQRYNNPPIYITENGVDVPNENGIPFPDVLNDPFRVSFYEQYLSNVSDAIYTHGVQVKGYFAWSFMDNFEWADGYSKRFGLVYVDYDNNLTRHPKSSANFFTNLINPNVTTTTLTSSTSVSTTTSGGMSLTPWIFGIALVNVVLILVQ